MKEEQFRLFKFSITTMWQSFATTKVHGKFLKILKIIHGIIVESSQIIDFTCRRSFIMCFESSSTQEGKLLS